MGRLRFLVVAPEQSDLKNIDAELAAIGAWHEIVPEPPLVGYVTDLDLMRVVSQVECDVIAWLTHGNSTGVLLSEGIALDANGVAQFVRGSKAQLCILNTCDSEQLALRIAYLCKIDVIYTRGEVGDRDAAIYMGQLAAALAEEDDVVAAYVAVGAHGGKYRLIEGHDSIMRSRGSEQEWAALDKRVAVVQAWMMMMFVAMFVLALAFALYAVGVSHRLDAIDANLVGQIDGVERRLEQMRDQVQALMVRQGTTEKGPVGPE